jgi:hypothetical protein
MFFFGHRYCPRTVPGHRYWPLSIHTVPFDLEAAPFSGGGRVLPPCEGFFPLVSTLGNELGASLWELAHVIFLIFNSPINRVGEPDFYKAHHQEDERH